MSILASIPGRVEAIRYKVSTIRKAIVPVVAGIISVLSITAFNADPEIVAAVVAVATALGVYQAPNIAQEPQDAGGGA